MHVIGKLIIQHLHGKQLFWFYFFQGCSVFTDMLHLFVSNNSYELLKHY